MPSPTSNTRPTSRASRPALAPLISRSSTETISSTLNAMTAPLGQLPADRQQAGTHAGVIDPILYSDDDPTQEVGIDDLLEDRLQVRHVLQLVDDATTFVIGQGHGGGHMDDDAVRLLVV